MQVQWFNTLSRIAVGTVMACGLMLLAGCYVDGGSVSSSVSRNNQTGATTTTVTGTINIKRGHPPLQQFAMWMNALSGIDLAGFDPSQAIMTYTLSDATIASTGGLVTVTLTDSDTGATVSQQTFQYTVRGNGLFAQDPTAVSAWLNQFTSYASLDMTATANTDVQVIDPGTVTVTNNVLYQGTSYASASTSWVAAYGDGGGTGCTPRICPNQE